MLTLFVLTLLAASAQASPGEKRPFWFNKISPQLKRVPAAETAEFFLVLTDQADLVAAEGLPGKDQKGQFVYEQLTAVARRTQPAVVAHLEALDVPYRQFWITNMIWVQGNTQVMEQLAARSDIWAIEPNPQIQLELQPAFPAAKQLAGPTGIEWNISQINAPAVWGLGYEGEGVVIGGQDTGYEWEHPALISQYRGWNGSTASHDYNWHDAIKQGGNGVCGSNSPEPCDDFSSSHGTHTMGTAVGDDGASNQIGVAPGAEWIGCRNMNQGIGTPATYTECYQWFVAPYPLGGDPMTDGDPAKAPDVITNSWACPPSEGCTATSLQTVVQNVRAAGIVTVHSAGNSGSGCQTVLNPAGHFQESFTVGSTTSSDEISSFSSRGPVTIGVNSWRKPDITAPGSGIRSAMRDNTYGSLSGTSMAAPHVAGLVALLLSAEPSLKGQVNMVENIIRQTAVHLTSLQGCGGDSAAQSPNNVYGFGRIDALTMVTFLDFVQVFLPIAAE